MPSPHVSAQLGPLIRCAGCGATQEARAHGLVRLAAIGSGFPCARCDLEVDAWPALVDALTTSNDLWHAIAFVGGGQVVFTVDARTDESLELDLRLHGVPEDARVLRMVQTPQERRGVGLPVFVPARQTLGVTALEPWLVLHPLALGGPVEEVCRLAITVAWAPAVTNDASDELLTSAFIAFGDADYKRAVLDAHTALDVRLREAIQPCLQLCGLPKRERLGLMQRLAVFTALTRSLGLPLLDDRVRVAATALHEARNGPTVAHGGSALDPGEVAPLLAAGCVASAHVGDARPALHESFGIEPEDV